MARTTFSGPVRSLAGFEGDMSAPSATERGGVLQQTAPTIVVSAAFDQTELQTAFDDLVNLLKAAGVIAP